MRPQPRPRADKPVPRSFPCTTSSAFTPVRSSTPAAIRPWRWRGSCARASRGGRRGGSGAKTRGVPRLKGVDGGKRGDSRVGLRELMIRPWGCGSFEDGFRSCVEIYHTLKKVLHERHLSTAVGDEGGFAPDLKSAE